MKMAMTISFVALAFLTHFSSIFATPVSVDGWNLSLRVDAGAPSNPGLSSFVTVEDNTVTLPLHLTRTATDAPSSSETTYEFSVGTTVASYRIDFDHVRGGIDNPGIGGEGDSIAESYGTIDFTAIDDVPYSLAGQYALSGSKLMRFRGRLFDVTAANVLFENRQSSGHTLNEHFVFGETGGDLPFGANYPDYIDFLTGGLQGQLTTGHSYQFSYEATIFTVVGGADDGGATAAGFVSLALGGVYFGNAGPDDLAFVVGTRSGNGGVPAPPETIIFKGLELLDGSSFTLDPQETLVLTGGPLYIGPGAVFTGNGVIQGNVINAGLLRIPIVRVPTIAQTTGGHIQVELPEPTFGKIFIDLSGGGSGFAVGGGTLLSFEFADDVPAPIVIEGDPAPNEGTIRFDASLEITGSYEQRDTGALRLFIAGKDQPGVNYSQLTVGQGVSLAGKIELVLEPELFGEFGYAPKVGDTFDLIKAPQGITIAGAGLDLLSFVTEDGQRLLRGLTLSPYVSGIAADPDHLLQIGEMIFRLDLVDSDTILRATLISPVSVPEPATVTLAAFVVAVLLANGLIRRQSGP